MFQGVHRLVPTTAVRPFACLKVFSKSALQLGGYDVLKDAYTKRVKREMRFDEVPAPALIVAPSAHSDSLRD